MRAVRRWRMSPLTGSGVAYLELDGDGWRFQARVAAVCRWRDHVLLQRALDGEFWVLPGGRVLPLEPTANALARTMQWEIGEEVTVGRLLWVMEYVTPMGGRPVHELGFYYAVELPDHSPFLDVTRDHAGVERGLDLVLRWVPVGDLPSVALYPTSLRTSLREVPGGVGHVVQVDLDPGSMVDARPAEDAP